MQVCTSSQKNTPTSHHSVFYRPDALLTPNQQRQSSEGKDDIKSVFNAFKRNGNFSRDQQSFKTSKILLRLVILISHQQFLKISFKTRFILLF